VKEAGQGERLGTGAATDGWSRFAYQDGQPGPCQCQRGGEPVRPRTNDDGIVALQVIPRIECVAGRVCKSANPRKSRSRRKVCQNQDRRIP
jgi:hypothetical protein